MEASLQVLRRVDTDKNMDRFYELTLQPTLFGDWAVVRRWGRFDSGGQKREVWFEAYATALTFMDRLHNKKRKRGYFDLGATRC